MAPTIWTTAKQASHAVCPVDRRLGRLAQRRSAERRGRLSIDRGRRLRRPRRIERRRVDISPRTRGMRRFIGALGRDDRDTCEVLRQVRAHTLAEPRAESRAPRTWLPPSRVLGSLAAPQLPTSPGRFHVHPGHGSTAVAWTSLHYAKSWSATIGATPRASSTIRDERIAAHVQAQARRGPALARPAAAAQPGVRARRLDRRADRRGHSCTTSAADLPGGEAPTDPRRREPSCFTSTRPTRSGRRSTGANYVLTTGTGSGKSLAYIVPIVDYVLRNGRGGRPHQGDRRLSDERAGQQPGERAGEVPASSATRTASRR